MDANNKIISRGFMVVFNVPSNGSDYFNTLDEANILFILHTIMTKLK